MSHSLLDDDSRFAPGGVDSYYKNDPVKYNNALLDNGTNVDNLIGFVK